jgi:hypothetical protein
MPEISFHRINGFTMISMIFCAGLVAILMGAVVFVWLQKRKPRFSSARPN